MGIQFSPGVVFLSEKENHDYDISMNCFIVYQKLTDALNYFWRAQCKLLFFLPCQRSEGLLISPSLSRDTFLFLIGKLTMGLVMLPLMTLHRLSLSPTSVSLGPGQSGGPGRLGDTRPGPEGEITWSGLTGDSTVITNINHVLLPRGPMHVLPLG